MPLCARCRLAGAGLRYQGRGIALWFCAKCWRDVRNFPAYSRSWFTRWVLTEGVDEAENGDAETSSDQLPAPANPLPAEA